MKIIHLAGLMIALLCLIFSAMVTAKDKPPSKYSCTEVDELEYLEVPYTVAYTIGYLNAKGELTIEEDDYVEWDDIPYEDILVYCEKNPDKMLKDSVKHHVKYRGKRKH